ncbi:mRNA transport regulator MTR10 NDAI_0C01200 [Naumovozyma dairenensis CBS 421]|uniref:Importin N-terminal domain-containing protein n=1 Tax=Naumovozyma dairenensis (strain ATCC 10597 / BCRC 20456 / CBS 421 / NBRC 0211 / NRRL Y-12639) TaxID=1071378 RepID=G0W7M0_NAUDC|nr:hypothetical protein NDAI_0C01200 [Naumovozyma dairenensis CBS 421]CCD23781.1 hypothetical protein NDAI_0C01200 [Naumovozyma dairenensis CBS 421]
MSAANRLVDLQAALQCISSNATQDDKNKALHYLEQFQRSTEAWSVCHDVLINTDAQLLELHIFAAQTLRNKITYDLSQLDNNLMDLKNSLLQLLTVHSQKLVVTQLSIALARLAIQFLDWKDPVIEIINVLNPYPSVLLGFLRILPEETLDIGSTPLTQDEFNSRIHELIDSIAEDVLKFLITCTTLLKQSTNSGISMELILRCLNSWSFEFPIEELLTVEPLISLVFESLLNGAHDSSDIFDAAVDCLCVILRESRDAPNESLVMALYEQLMNIQRKLLPNILLNTTTDEDIDEDILDGLTRIFVEAGEAWIVFISKSPQVFNQMVTVLLMLACKNQDLDIVSYTFPFWFNLKQNLVLARYKESQIAYTPIFVQLINGIITHLQYPIDQFESKETEDKFKEFRYHMGDVLKDCTAVVGPKEALAQPLTRINMALKNTTNINSNWQQLEAPLFSLRTMAQEVPLSESTQLPQIFKILCNLPEHPKIRYAATLVLGRYTEWTSKHPEMLEMQLQYIFNGFQVTSAPVSSAPSPSSSGTVSPSPIISNKANSDIITASSHALMYFCSDCSKLLSGYIDQLIDFYFNVENVIDIESQFELCQGLSAVINSQPSDKIVEVFNKLSMRNLNKLNELVIKWKQSPSPYNVQISDVIDLFYALFEELKPRFEYPQQGMEPLLPSIENVWNNLKILLIDQGALQDEMIVERVTKFLRRLFEKFHVFCEPILGSVAEMLVQGYANTGYGTFLWCSGSIIVVFGDDESFPVSKELKDAVWQFALSQCNTFILNFEKMDKSRLNDYYELIMDFFAMISDLVMFYPQDFILSGGLLLGNVVDVAVISVNKLENYDAYVSILRCLDDIISWGFNTPPISTVSLEFVPNEWRQAIVDEVIIKRGSQIIDSLIIGLVTTFDSDSHSDAISCIVKCFKLATEANNGNANICNEWVCQAIDKLGQVTVKERDNLNNAIYTGLTQRDYRKVREGVRAFVEWYLRKTVSSRME